MKTIEDLKIGDTVWYTDVNHSRVSEGVVEKIGSKLISTKYVVFRKDTMRTNDAYGHQTLIIDLEHYKQIQDTKRILQLIRQQHLTLSDITLADVIAAAKLLKIKF